MDQFFKTKKETEFVKRKKSKTHKPNIEEEIEDDSDSAEEAKKVEIEKPVTLSERKRATSERISS